MLSRERLCAVVLNYRTAETTLGCLESLAAQLDPRQDRALVVDNASGDGSAERLRRAIRERGWSGFRVLESDCNGGFSHGMTLGMRAARARAYLLLNSDTRLRPGAVAALWDELCSDPAIGLVSPRLESPAGEPQTSCFRFHTPASELIDAARTGPLRRLLARWDVPLPVSEASQEPAWTSFAAVLIADRAIERVGLLDPGFFMYFEDVDYCRRVWRAGLRVRHQPRARVVHLRGGSLPLDELVRARARLPGFYFASRARYFRKAFGPWGPLAANLCWTLGRAVAFARERLGGKTPHSCESQLRDIWREGRGEMAPRAVGAVRCGS